MKILVTQRVDEFGAYKERRDSLDQRWYDFFHKIGVTPILVPNKLSLVKNLIAGIDYDGLLLTGGNTLIHLPGGDAPERDEVEKFLMKETLNRSKPIVGVCRGFQLIHHFFGGDLIPLEGYAGHKHHLQLNDEDKKREVTTHCGFGFKSSPFDIISVDENGVVMSAEKKEKKIYGQIWHPEREVNSSPEDVQLFKKYFGVENE